MTQQPSVSAYKRTSGMTYFARMLDKIRLHHQGLLHPDYHDNLGKGVDGWCCGFLRVDYSDVIKRTLEGGTDEEVLQWCFVKGRELDRGDLLIWNSFCTKLGWDDFASPLLKKLKAEGGLEDRDDLITMADYFEVDEGRKE